jgi:hypothetical protein
VLDLTQELGKRGAACLERGLAQILAVEFEQVERIQEHRLVMHPGRAEA